jgi:hypothetical protein
MKAIFALIFFAAFYAAPEAKAQLPTAPSTAMRTDFSENELRSFVKASEKVTAIQMKGEQNMIKAIEDEGLTVDRFHELLEKQRDPQRGTETSISAAELKSFNNAAQMILDENERLEKEMATSIEEEGIDVETYEEIMLAYQHNAAVQNRVNKMVNDSQQN